MAYPTLPRGATLSRLRLRDLTLLLAIHEHRSITGGVGHKE